MAAPIKHGVVPKRALAIWSSRDVRENGQWGSNALGLELGWLRGLLIHETASCCKWLAHASMCGMDVLLVWHACLLSHASASVVGYRHVCGPCVVSSLFYSCIINMLIYLVSASAS